MAQPKRHPQGVVEVSSQGDGPLPIVQKNLAFDSSIKDIILSQNNDPIFYAMHNTWADRQEYGRLALEAAYKHRVVYAAFNARKAILISKKPRYKKRQREPTHFQKEVLEFYQRELDRLDWSQFIHGVRGQALHHGFSLTEIVTKYETWKGKTMVTLDYLSTLPQATLDNGYISRSEFSAYSIQNDPRYRCFDMDVKGRITAYKQFGYRGTAPNGGDVVEWRGDDMQYILHHKHRGGDANPWGESAFYGAMDSWASLYTLEKMEEVFLDTSLPWMVFSYKTASGEIRTAVNDGILDAMDKAYVDAGHRVLIIPDGTGESVAPSNENFTDHIFRKKGESEEGIWQTLLFPKSLISETSASDTDSRNLVQVFFKYIIKADLEEIGKTVDDLMFRLASANYNLTPDDAPLIDWSNVTENEMRTAQSLLISILPHVESDQLGDFIHSLFDFVDPNLIAKEHSDSVGAKRVIEAPDAQTNVNDPPPKEEGEVRERMDGQTDNPSGTTGASA